jgi:sirohydrochlorin cobaltochelatase
LHVQAKDLSRAAVVLLGHGTTQNPESGANVINHAAQLRARGIFGEVREAFWKQEPRVHDVLASLVHETVYLVPMFISEGFFSQEIIPRELGLAGDGAPAMPHRVPLRYCRPVGSHPHMVDVILERAQEVIARCPFPRAPKLSEVSLFIAAHGTGENRHSRLNVDRQADLIRSRNLYAGVDSIFLDEEPRIGACYDLARTRHLVVVPFFMGDGLHVTEDIPVLLGEPERIVQQRLASGQSTWRNPSEKNGKMVWYAGSVGSHPAMADVVLDCVRDFDPE